jgi:hypothetical protein
MRMMNEFEAQVLSDLSALKTQMTGLLGDGNGGRLANLERRMERHEQNWQRAKGFLAAVSILFAVVEVAVEALHQSNLQNSFEMSICVRARLQSCRKSEIKYVGL